MKLIAAVHLAIEIKINIFVVREGGEERGLKVSGALDKNRLYNPSNNKVPGRAGFFYRYFVTSFQHHFNCKIQSAPTQSAILGFCDGCSNPRFEFEPLVRCTSICVWLISANDELPHPRLLHHLHRTKLHTYFRTRRKKDESSQWLPGGPITPSYRPESCELQQS